MLRRSISVLAVVAVLLHAAALVRHAVAMGSLKPSAEIALLADLGIICHTDAQGGGTAVADAPATQKPDAPGKCPQCLGLATGAFLPPGPQHVLPPATGPPVSYTALDATFAPAAGRGLLPPARGPPLA